MDAPRLIKEEQLHKWYGKRVLKRTYQMPDNSKDDFYVFGGQTPVIIFALTENQEVIAVRQFRYGVDEFVLEVPGGIIRASDSPGQTVQKRIA